MPKLGLDSLRDEIEVEVFRSHVKIPLIFLVPLAFLASLYAGLYLYANSEGFEVDIMDLLHQQLGGQFAAEEIVVDPSLVRVHIYNAEVATPEGDPTITAEEAHAEINPLLLLVERISFSEARVRGADVHLGFDEQDNLNLLEALGVETDDEDDEEVDQDGIAVEFSSITVEDSKFSFEMEDFRFDIPHVNIPQASISIEPDNLLMSVPRLYVDAIDFTFEPELMGLGPEYGDWEFTVRYVDIDNWRWVADGFAVEHVGLYSEGVQMDARGQMAFPSGDDTPDMTYEGVATASAPMWTPLLQYFVDETIHFEVPEIVVATEGDLERVDAGAEVYASVLETSGLYFEDVRGSVALRNHWVEVFDATADLHGGTIDIPYAWVNIYDITYGALGTFEGVNPRSVINDFDVDLPWVDGRMSGGIELSGGLPPDLEYSFDDHRTIQNLVERKYADVEVTEDIVLRRRNQQLFPGTVARLERGSRFWVDPERVALPSARLMLGADAFVIEDFLFDYEYMRFGPTTPGSPTRISADLKDLGPWFEMYGVEGVTGSAHLHTTVVGPVASPDVSMRVAEQDAAIELPEATVAADELALDLRLRDGRLSINEARVRTGLGKASASGWIDVLDPNPPQHLIDEGEFALRRTHPADLNVAVEDVDLRAAAALGGLDVPVRGELDAEGALAGSLENPQGSFGARVRQADVAGQQIPYAELDGTVEREGVVVNKLTVDAAGAGTFDAEGQYGFDETYTFNFRGDGINLSQVAALQDLPESLQPKGRGEVRLHGAGSIDEPTVAGDMRMRSMELGARDLGDAALVVDTVDDTVYVTGALLPLVTLQLEVPLDESSPYYVRVGMEELDLTDAVDELARSRAVSSFTTTGMLEIFMEKDFSRYQILSYLTDVDMRTMGRRIRNRGPLVFGINNGEMLQIQQATIGTRNRFVTLEGGVILDPLLLDVSAQGSLDLSLLTTARRAFPSYFPSSFVESRGKLTADASFRGPPDNIVADGFVSFDRAEISIRDLPEPIRFTQGEVRFRRNRIFVPEDKQLRGGALGGLFRVHGELSMVDRELGRLDVRGWTHNMNYRISDTANVTFDTDLRIRARNVYDFSTYLVSGGIDVLDGRFYRNISLVEEEVTGRVLGAFNRQTERYEASLLDEVPELRNIEMDLAVRARDGFTVENEIDRLSLDLELRIDLRLRETLGDPSLSGNIDVIDGGVTFQGEVFDVRSGTLRFTGKPENPYIDIIAGADVKNRCREGRLSDDFDTDIDLTGDLEQTEQQEYHVILNITGKADNLNVQLDSNPYADQRDILSLLLTGCTVDQLTASSASGPTLEIALGPLLGRIEKEVQDVVKVSEFSIMPGVERTQVRIGDTLTRRLSWNFQLESGISETAGGQRYELEYKLSDNWSAELSERSQGEGNDLLIDLKLRYRLPLD
ncbi:MAG: translocation/assembly module TamB domain-containing protein [Myxococcota bacterium]